MFWEYDTRLGRRWNLDPKPTIGVSDYACFNDNPIQFSDVNGDKPGDKDKKAKDANTSADKSKPVEPKKTLDTKTVGRNFDNSNYISNKNPLNTDGSDSFEPKAQDDQDANAKEHDMSNATFGNRTAAGLKADAKFIYNSAKIVAKKLENDIVLPIAGANPNKDNTTGRELTATTAYQRAAPSGAFLTLWTAAKVALAVTYDPAVKAYDATVDFANEVKYKTEQGLNAMQNWSPR